MWLLTTELYSAATGGGGEIGRHHGLHHLQYLSNMKLQGPSFKKIIKSFKRASAEQAWSLSLGLQRAHTYEVGPVERIHSYKTTAYIFFLVRLHASVHIILYPHCAPDS